MKLLRGNDEMVIGKGKNEILRKTSVAPLCPEPIVELPWTEPGEKPVSNYNLQYDYHWK
jgi:hypothetical protein